MKDEKMKTIYMGVENGKRDEFQMRSSKSDRGLLIKLAKYHNTSMSQVIRNLIREEAKRVEEEKKNGKKERV